MIVLSVVSGKTGQVADSGLLVVCIDEAIEVTRITGKPGILRRKIVVQTDRCLTAVVRAWRRMGVVSRDYSRNDGLRIKRHHFHTSRMKSIGGDDVSWERLSRQRIRNNRRPCNFIQIEKFGKVAAPHKLRRHGRRTSLALDQS